MAEFRYPKTPKQLFLKPHIGLQYCSDYLNPAKMSRVQLIRDGVQLIKANSHLNAFISVRPEQVLLEEAQLADQRWAEGKWAIEGELID